MPTQFAAGKCFVILAVDIAGEESENEPRKEAGASEPDSNQRESNLHESNLAEQRTYFVRGNANRSAPLPEFYSVHQRTLILICWLFATSSGHGLRMRERRVDFFHHRFVSVVSSAFSRLLPAFSGLFYINTASCVVLLHHRLEKDEVPETRKKQEKRC